MNKATSRFELATLKNRSGFLAMKSGARIHARAFILQARMRNRDEMTGPAGQNAGLIRFGYTVTKRTGNSVVRNRIRRRLRAAVQICAPGHAKPGYDYVLIGKRQALTEDFTTITSQLAKALDRGSAPGANPQSRKPPNRPVAKDRTKPVEADTGK